MIFKLRMESQKNLCKIQVLRILAKGLKETSFKDGTEINSENHQSPHPLQNSVRD